MILGKGNVFIDLEGIIGVLWILEKEENDKKERGFGGGKGLKWRFGGIIVWLAWTFEQQI